MIKEMLISAVLMAGTWGPHPEDTIMVTPDAAEIEMFNIGITPFTITETNGYTLEKQNGIYHVTFSQVISYVDYYRDLIDGLRQLKPEDTVVLHINNFGGYVHTGLEIITAMEDSPAHIIARVESPSYSMASLIACAADELYIADQAFLMFHTYSGNFGGKGSDAGKSIEALDSLMERVLKKYCSKLLTDEQIQDMLNGVDIYVHPAKN